MLQPLGNTFPRIKCSDSPIYGMIRLAKTARALMAMKMQKGSAKGRYFDIFRPLITSTKVDIN